MADRTLTVRIELEGADTVRDALGRFAGDTRSAVMQLASAGSTLGASLQQTSDLIDSSTRGIGRDIGTLEAAIGASYVAAGRRISAAGEDVASLSRTIERSTSEVVKVGAKAFDKLFATGRIEAFGDAMVSILRGALA